MTFIGWCNGARHYSWSSLQSCAPASHTQRSQSAWVSTNATTMRSLAPRHTCQCHTCTDCWIHIHVDPTHTHTHSLILPTAQSTEHFYYPPIPMAKHHIWQLVQPIKAIPWYHIIQVPNNCQTLVETMRKGTAVVFLLRLFWPPWFAVAKQLQILLFVLRQKF